MPPQLDALLENCAAREAQDSIDAQRQHRLVRARLLDETVPQTRIDRYVVEGRLGSGGMGVVYAACDEQLDRPVAIKLVRGASESPAAQQRLLREARALARLAHPHVVTIYDVGLHDDRVFLAMELLPGPTLRGHRVDDTTQWRAVVDTYVQAGEGLAAAHAVGLVHRDFKPDNAMLGPDGRVRVVDFGLALSHGDDASATSDAGTTSATPALTATGKVVGTPAYMAPEQFDGAPADARSDQFSFCVALWEALFGERPFAGNTTAALRMAVAHGSITPPSHPQHAPAWLRAVLRRGLSPDPDARWPSMSALLEACTRNPRRWRRGWFALGGVVAVGLLGLGVDMGLRHQRRRACAHAAAAIDTIWNDTTAQAAAAAFVALDATQGQANADRLAVPLAQWRDRWRTVAGQACEATEVHGTLNAAQGARRRGCLQLQRERLGTLVEVALHPARDTAGPTLRAAYELPPPALCQDDARLAVQAKALGAVAMLPVAAELRAQLTRADALVAAGRSTQARDLALAVQAKGTRWGDPALQAEALRVRAAAERALGDYEAAAVAAERAYFIAHAAGADEIALRAATAMVDIVGVQLARPDQGEAWRRHAEGLRAQIEAEPGWLAAELSANVAWLRQRTGDFEGARAAAEQTIALRSAVAGAEHPSVGLALANLGTLLAERGDPQASALMDRAERIVAATLGDTSDAVAGIETARCVALARQGASDQGVAHCERALGIREAMLGADHPTVAVALSNLAGVRVGLGDLAGARTLSERATAIERAHFGASHPRVGKALRNLGWLAYRAGDSGAAKARLTEALEVLRSVEPVVPVDVAATLVQLGEVYAASGQTARAIETLDEAVGMTAANPALAAEHGDALAKRGITRLLAGEHALAVQDLEAAIHLPHANHPAAACELRYNLVKALQRVPGGEAQVRKAARAAHPLCERGGPQFAGVLVELAAWTGDEGSSAPD